MKMRLTSILLPESSPIDFPDADELAMLRAWYAGMPVRKAVGRYLLERIGAGQSARGVLGAARRRLAKIARQAGRISPRFLSTLTVSVYGKRGRSQTRSRCCDTRACRPRRSVTTRHLAARASGRDPARARYLDAVGPHRTDSAPAPMVESHSRPRARQCATYRGVLRGAPGVNRAGESAHRRPVGQRYRAMGTGAATPRGRRLGRRLSRPARHLHA